MGRQARKVSASHIYHVMTRGINQQEIFEDHDDEVMFMSLLDEFAVRCGYVLYGYCLMNNHIHLLIHEAKNPSKITVNHVPIEAGPGETLAQAMKRICVSYVMYFNGKYARTGHLFQGRFKSEPINGDAQFLNVLRYIHLNPVKAELCRNPQEYEGSSYRAYLGECPARHVDTSLGLSLLSRDQLIAYTNAVNTDQFLDTADRSHLKSDLEIKRILMEQHHIPSVAAFQELEKAAQAHLFRALLSDGATIAQISRLTGCSRTVIKRACVVRSGQKG